MISGDVVVLRKFVFYALDNRNVGRELKSTTGLPERMYSETRKPSVFARSSERAPFEYFLKVFSTFSQARRFNVAYSI